MTPSRSDAQTMRAGAALAGTTHATAEKHARSHGTEIAVARSMTKTTTPTNAATPEQQEAAKIHKHEVLVDAELTAAGGVSGAAIGAMIGSIGGPPGAIAGALVGGAIGAASGYAVEVDHHRDSRHDHDLDEEIGVTSGSIGARSTKNAPSEVAEGEPRAKPPAT